MSTLALKILAILFMFIDHLGFAIGSSTFAAMNFSGGYYFCRAIGRLAFPIFAFLIANGFKHTKNLKKYILRLFAFAIISEVPFDLFVSGKVTLISLSGLLPDFRFDNVFFTLLLGLLFLCLHRYYTEKFDKYAWAASSVTLFVLCAFAGFITSDYGAVGVAWVALFGLFDIQNREKMPFLFMGAAVLAYWRIIARCILVAIYRLTAVNISTVPVLSYFFADSWNVMSFIQPFALVAFGFLLMYNGKSGMPENKCAKKAWQYAFYLFYPLHILILYLIFR